MKSVIIAAFVLLMVVSDVSGQDVKMAAEPATWQRYTVKNEHFSVELPAHPAMSKGSRTIGRSRDERREITLGVYADGIVYMVYTLENFEAGMAFSDFCKEVASRPMWDRASEKKVSLKGAGGRQYFSNHSLGGAVQLFSDYGRLYRFQAFGAPADHPRVKQFFSSIILSDKADGIRVSDGVGVPFTHTGQLEPNAELKVFPDKEVDRKALIVIKPEPEFTAAARRGQISGTVVLRAVVAADGRVTDIQLMSGLPDGLTERAIDAARKIKFIPAMKDGKFVSMKVQLEYNFNLY